MSGSSVCFRAAAQCPESTGKESLKRPTRRGERAPNSPQRPLLSESETRRGHKYILIDIYELCLLYAASVVPIVMCNIFSSIYCMVWHGVVNKQSKTRVRAPNSMILSESDINYVLLIT